MLFTLVWTYSLTEAKASLTPRTTQRSLSHSLFARLIQPDFYQVIITNNLFRPLGWTKAKPKPAFELIATVMKTNSRLQKALIRNTRNRKLYYAAVGELAGEAIVEKIEAHRVTLNRDGGSKVYRLPL